MAQRRLRGWNPLETINSLVASGGPRLLARARELGVANGYAANACEDVVAPPAPTKRKEHGRRECRRRNLERATMNDGPQIQTAGWRRARTAAPVWVLAPKTI